MKTIIELDAKDIKKAIADHYHVEEGKVRVEIRQECRGYGQGEHMEYVPVCTIEKADGI